MSKPGKFPIKFTIKMIAKSDHLTALEFIALRDPVLLWFNNQELCGHYGTYLHRTGVNGPFFQTFIFDDIRDVILFKVTWDRMIEGVKFEGW